MPPKPKKISFKTKGRLITAVVLALMLVMVGWTVWFLYDVLNSATATGSNGATGAVRAETLDTDLLDKIEKDLIAKVTRPVPEPEDLRNPFLIPPEPPAAPIVETPAEPDVPAAPPDETPPADE